MEELHKDQKQIAKDLGVHPSAVNRALHEGPIGLDFVIAMHRRLGISANALLDGEPQD